jgi:hypothetical protein
MPRLCLGLRPLIRRVEFLLGVIDVEQETSAGEVAMVIERNRSLAVSVNQT